MRVIAGKARRLILRSAPGLDTRPTTDRIKETLFNILNPYLPEADFLDLFAGSGGIGIEALSRGARKAAFVDSSPQAIRCIRENLEHTKLLDQAVIIQKNVLNGIRELSVKKMKFDLVYMDPPYQLGIEEDTLKALAESGIIHEDTMVILEADKHLDLSFLDQTLFEITREKVYKTNKHIFLRLRS